MIFKISEQLRSEHVVFQAQATYKGVTYTKQYDVNYIGCDIEDCSKCVDWVSDTCEK